MITHCGVDFACSYWTGTLPWQGWLYVSLNHLSFNAYIMGKETHIVLPWTDVVAIEQTTRMLLADGIAVRTRHHEVSIA
jgi:hypothetical protein